MIISTRISIIFAFVASMAVHEAHGQTGRIFKQPAFTFPKAMSWWDSIYLYPDFREGHITYFTGFTPERNLRLNYNLYFGQIDMIDAQGDTVQITPIKTFKAVSVGEDLFLYDQKEGYLRILVQGEVTLAERLFFHLAKAHLMYGGDPQNGSYPVVDVRGRSSNYDRTYIHTSIFYFMNSQGKFFLANPASLKKIIPEHKSSIHEFVRSHNTNYTNEADLRQLIQFCNDLRTN